MSREAAYAEFPKLFVFKNFFSKFCDEQLFENLGCHSERRAGLKSAMCRRDRSVQFSVFWGSSNQICLSLELNKFNLWTYIAT